MKTRFKAFWLVLFVLSIFSCNPSSSDTKNTAADSLPTENATIKDPLPSWNDGAAKKAITDFVTKTTRVGGPDFVPVADRIACFDNDGTLWTEAPIPFQLYFIIDRIKAMAPQHPEWKNKQPFKAILEGNLGAALAGGEKSLIELTTASTAGISTEAYEGYVKEWIDTATHPKTQRHFKELVYQPMLELLDYLRANDYKPFIVSGGGIDFMRVWAEDVYKIPPYQIVGSSFKTRYDTSGATPQLLKLPEFNFNDDKLGKPVGIRQHIGKRPVFTAGNSDGDYAMMQYTSTGAGPRFGLYVHHTDSLREFFYGDGPGLAQLKKGLADAPKYNWLIVDMKTDWKKVYPFEK